MEATVGILAPQISLIVIHYLIWTDRVH